MKRNRRTAFGLRLLILTAAAFLLFTAAASAASFGTPGEAAEALENASSTDEQLRILYDASLLFSLELETGGWDASLTCDAADDLPADLRYSEEDLNAMAPVSLTAEDLRDAKIVCLYNDQGTLRILGDFQVRIPERSRAASAEEADTVLYLLHTTESRSDYTGSAYDRVYEVSVFRRGTNERCRIHSRSTTPPLSGYGTLYGDRLSLSEIWRGVRPFFFDTFGIRYPEGTATYRITGSTCCLAKLEGDFVRFEVPGSADGYPVTGIEYCSNEVLEELVLPEGIVWIQTISCGNLRKMNFPSTLRRITGSISVDNMEHVNLNEGLEEIGDFALTRARGEDFSLPSTLKVVGTGTLEYGVECPYLIVGEGVEKLPSMFVGESRRLLAVYIPDTVKSIDGSISGGKSVIFTPENSVAAWMAEDKGWRWIPCEKASDMPLPYYGSENGFEYGVVGNEAVLLEYSGSGEYVRIPDTLGGYPVTTIQSGAFGSNNFVRSVVLPETVTLARDSFFSDCGNLTSLFIPGTDFVLQLGSSMTESCGAGFTVFVPADSARAEAWRESDWLPWAVWEPGAEEKPAYAPFAWDEDQLAALRTPGSTVLFGRRPPEDGESGEAEPLEWLVLAAEEGRSLLITKDALTKTVFDNSTNHPTHMSWRDSSLRGILQTEYYDAMFTPAERDAILSVRNEKLYEKIFLLSTEQVETFLPSEAGRKCEFRGSAQPWWLRTGASESGGNYGRLMYVNDDGAVPEKGMHYDSSCLLRPAVWVRTD